MPEYAVGLKFEFVIHREADSIEEAKELALDDEEAHGMALAHAKPTVLFCEEDG